jgi:predicted RNase H-like nuclease (RuvC/YqgF family)
MSLIGTAIGALVALLPRPTLDKADARFIAGYDAGLKDGRREAKDAQVEVERLTRSHARLVDHIETLEREILVEQHICRHWKEEAERLARASREAREERDRRALQTQLQMLQSQAAQQQLGLQQNQQLAAYADPALQTAHENMLGAQNALAAYNQQAYAGFCNCVPSRAQVWGAQRQD